MLNKRPYKNSMYRVNSVEKRPTKASEEANAGEIPGCKGIYNSTNDIYFNGYEGYYFTPERFEAFVPAYIQATEERKDLDSPECFVGTLEDFLPYPSVYIGPGEQFGWDKYPELDKPDGCDVREVNYDVGGEYADWFIMAFEPESGKFDNEHIMKTGIVCEDPWEYRKKLVKEGYIEVC